MLQKRRSRPPTRVRLYRISPHCPDAPLYLVPKAVSARPGCSHPDWTQLDPRGCFLAQLHNKVSAIAGGSSKQGGAGLVVQAHAQAACCMGVCVRSVHCLIGPLRLVGTCCASPAVSQHQALGVLQRRGLIYVRGCGGPRCSCLVRQDLD